MMRMTAFDLGEHAFRFSNRGFKNHRFLGPIHVTTDGRCGGMVYSALDFYYSPNRTIPRDTQLPPEGSVLSTYISSRQERSTLDSLDKWIELSFNPFGWRTREFWNWGIQERGGGRAAELKQEIDAGRPVPLGLFNAHDHFAHHVVLATGYEGQGLDLRIAVYDPNYPFNPQSPDGSLRILRPVEHGSDPRYDYVGSSGSVPEKRWLTYFVNLNYRMKDPDLDVPRGIDISGEDWSGRRFDNQDFRNISAIGTNFTGATMMQCDFSGEESNLSRAVFLGANLRNSSFASAELEQALFYGSDLKDCTFAFAKVPRGIFRGADMKLADCNDAMLEQCDFHGADLHRATLERVDADLASFYGASLNSAHLSGGTFRRANLTGADLRNADLRRADFRGAILTNADLTSALTDGAMGI